MTGGTLTALGLMSGTSLDGIDLAVLRTDGECEIAFGPTLSVPYTRDEKVWARRAVAAALEGREAATDIAKAEGELTDAHIRAIERLLRDHRLTRDEIDVIGFHGQTILHRPPADASAPGRSWQLGDGPHLAEMTKIDVVYDFRAADMAAGGEGAPFLPVYHNALVAALDPPADGPVGVINLGGVSNVTFVAESRDPLDLIAFDTGPGNGLIDEWCEFKTGAAMDADGALAQAGAVDDEALRLMLLHPYFRRSPPKSLDRYDFKLDAVRKLTTEDGAATLTAFTAEAVQRAEAHLPEPVSGWIVCGGGRRNPALMAALHERLQAPVAPAEEAGWRGDDLEAQGFAYMAVRSLKKLPISFPKTTRAPRPLPGGVFARAPV